MPISGTLDVSPLLGRTPLATDLATEPVVLPQAEVLYVMFEIDSEGVTSMLPPALHPTDPTIATFLWIRSKDGPLGTFTLAQTRIGCRAGVRPRGYVVGAVIDNAEALGQLADRWGVSAAIGDVDLTRGYDEIRGRAIIDGVTVLEAALVDPIPLSGAEIQFAASMHLARVQRNGSAEPRLVQVDPELTFHRAARGEPVLDEFDPSMHIKPVYPVSAWWSLCDLQLPKVRYICDPSVSALEGTEEIG